MPAARREALLVERVNLPKAQAKKLAAELKASKNEADVLGLPYHPLSCGDTAAWGSAILGGVACGLIASPAAAPAPAAQPPILPDERTRAVYRQKSAQYAAALRQQAAVYDAVQQPQEASPKATAGG